jgi:hypothetical protein
MALFHRPRSVSATAALDYEIAQEQAAALGRAGRALETALAALFEHDRHGLARGDARAGLVQQAGEALWRLIIQRECCGLRDPSPVMRDYRVPQEVQNCMGVFGTRARSRR